MVASPQKSSESKNDVHNAHPNFKAQSCRCLSGQGCNPIIMPLNTRWPFARCAHKHPLKKAQRLRTKCTSQSCTEMLEWARLQPDNPALEHQVAGRLLIPHLVVLVQTSHPGHQEVQSRANLLCPAPPFALLHQNPTNPNKALCTLPPLRPHEKPRSRKQLGKKHNLTISDKNIKLIKILPKVKCWMLMRKGGDVILFGWHEARYCDKWVVGGMMVCKQGVPN